MRRPAVVIVLSVFLVIAAAPATITGEGTLTLKGLKQPNTLQWTAEGQYRLTLEDSTLQARRIESDGKKIHAEGAVQATYGQMNVTGDTLDYDLDGQQMTVSGACTFKNETYEGSADTLTYTVASQDLTLDGNAHIKGETLEATAPKVNLMKGSQLDLPEGGHINQNGQEITLKSLTGVIANGEFTGTMQGPLIFKVDMGEQPVEVLADSAVKPEGTSLVLLENPKVNLNGGKVNSEKAEFDLKKNTAQFTGHVTGDYQTRRFTADKADMAFNSGHFTVKLTGSAQITLPRENLAKKL